jgi:CDP-diacylglycerol--serine O-phosphatidyltransferase
MSRWSKLRYLPPNAITAASLLLGFASVMRSAAGDFRLAAWMILWGVLLDKLDGTAARLLRATSDFGVQFDSFADFVVFGVAPAALVYFRLSSLGLSHEWVVLGGAGFFVLCTAARLARFNVTTPPMSDRYFYGVPTTMMGAVLGSSYLTWDKYGLDRNLLAAAPFVLVACGVLMVSTVKLPKLAMRDNKALNIFQIANILAAYTFGPLCMFPEYLLSIALVYLTVGLGWCALHPPRSAIAVDASEAEPEPTSEEPAAAA